MAGTLMMTICLGQSCKPSLKKSWLASLNMMFMGVQVEASLPSAPMVLPVAAEPVGDQVAGSKPKAAVPSALMVA